MTELTSTNSLSLCDDNAYQEQLPYPTMAKASIYRSQVQGVGSKNVLCSSSGNYYELSSIIKKSLFGLVIRACNVECVDVGSFKRAGGEVAIKLYSQELLKYHSSGTSQENPLLELSVLQYIGDDHPNLVGHVECCIDEHNIYSVMDLSKGVELFDYVLTNGRMEESEAKIIFRQLIEGLADLHDLGVSHRDISLENILYNPDDGSCSIIDFGMATKLQYNASSKMVVKISAALGKEHYMAPEAVGHPAGTVSPVDPTHGDVWSAGICLLYTLLGFPPLEKASESDLRYLYLKEGKLKDLVTHWGVDLSSDALDLLQSMLSIRPEQRPSALEILAHSFLSTVREHQGNDTAHSADSATELPETELVAYVVEQTEVNCLTTRTPQRENYDSESLLCRKRCRSESNLQYREGKKFVSCLSEASLESMAGASIDSVSSSGTPVKLVHIFNLDAGELSDSDFELIDNCNDNEDGSIQVVDNDEEHIESDHNELGFFYDHVTSAETFLLDEHVPCPIL